MIIFSQFLLKDFASQNVYLQQKISFKILIKITIVFFSFAKSITTKNIKTFFISKFVFKIKIVFLFEN